jgi:hypothetical protein
MFTDPGLQTIHLSILEQMYLSMLTPLCFWSYALHLLLCRVNVVLGQILKCLFKVFAALRSTSPTLDALSTPSVCTMLCQERNNTCLLCEIYKSILWPCSTLCLLCIHSVYSVFADPSLLHYDLLQQAINESNLLHRLQRCVMNLTPNMLKPNFRPSKLQMMGRELTEEEKSVMKLWRIRRILREQNGLPVDTSLDHQHPPTKRQRTPLPEFSPRKYPSPTPSECEPEGDTYGSQQYSPTQAKSASQDEDDYEEMGDDTS